MTKKIKGSYLIPKELEKTNNPYNWYHSMRQTNPVYFDPDRNCWDLFLYEDVKTVLKDHQTFSSKTNTPKIDSIVSMDPPEHQEFRKILNPAFKTKSIHSIKEDIQQTIDSLINTTTSSNQIELLNDIAYPLPIIIVSSILGLPTEDEDIRLFQRWSQNVLTRPEKQDIDSFIQASNKLMDIVEEMDVCFAPIIIEKKENPTDDILSNLVTYQSNGNHIDDKLISAICRTVLVGGNETTANLTGNLLVKILRNPEIYEQLKQDPSLIPTAIEEAIRYQSPFQCLARIATKDIEIGGHQIKKGENIVVWIGSANRDEKIFEDAHTFRLDRKSNPHLGFGFGVHHCIGAYLARMEVQMLLESLIKKFPNMTLMDPTIQKNKDFLVYGYDEIHISLGNSK